MRRPLWILVGPGLAAMLAVCQFALLLGPVREALLRGLGYAAGVIAIVVAVYVVSAAGGFAAGYPLGRRAPNSVVSSGLVLLLIGALVTAFTDVPALTAFAALLAGLGSGAVIGTAAGLTGEVEQKWRGRARLVLGLAMAVGLVAGPLLGWILSSLLGWRWAYLAAVPVTLMALVVTGAAGAVAISRRQA